MNIRLSARHPFPDFIALVVAIAAILALFAAPFFVNLDRVAGNPWTPAVALLFGIAGCVFGWASTTLFSAKRRDRA